MQARKQASPDMIPPAANSRTTPQQGCRPRSLPPGAHCTSASQSPFNSIHLAPADDVHGTGEFWTSVSLTSRASAARSSYPTGPTKRLEKKPDSECFLHIVFTLICTVRWRSRSVLWQCPFDSVVSSRCLLMPDKLLDLCLCSRIFPTRAVSNVRTAKWLHNGGARLSPTRPDTNGMNMAHGTWLKGGNGNNYAVSVWRGLTSLGKKLFDRQHTALGWVSQSWGKSFASSTQWDKHPIHTANAGVTKKTRLVPAMMISLAGRVVSMC
ncbi:unnamed protein product [Periconia digitata]|uniref:Uncharacterized protein n=1 Tax=Periconia digitata TaxID=1303443 RepID=A0A9W4UHU6_9PLEO|nr:unnamed protein product [Periconia digitata]